MAKDRSLVRASDIGLWGFCQRAWWLATVKEVAHQNPAILQQGTAHHLAHGRTVQRASQLRRIGQIVLLLALLLAAILVITMIIQIIAVPIQPAFLTADYADFTD